MLVDVSVSRDALARRPDPAVPPGTTIMRFSRSHLAVAACIAALVCMFTSRAVFGEVKIAEVDGKLRVEVDGKHFTDYVFRQPPRPFLYPVFGPGGQPMTRNYPMKKDIPGEARDHPHHRSIWHGHQGVNGHDLWSEGGRSGKIVHAELVEVKSGTKTGTIRAHNKWISRDGKVLCSDETTLTFSGNDDARIIDYEVKIFASAGKLTLSDQKDAFVSMRTHPALRVQPVDRKGPATGHALNSAGQKDKQLWGKAAKWVDYWGPVDGKTIGIAIFDHPTNLRHPTTWHARDYGLVTANPFGLHFFSGKKLPRDAGDYVLESGQSKRFRYRFYIHKGSAEDADIPKRYHQYVTEIK